MKRARRLEWSRHPVNHLIALVAAGALASSTGCVESEPADLVEAMAFDDDTYVPAEPPGDTWERGYDLAGFEHLVSGADIALANIEAFASGQRAVGRISGHEEELKVAARSDKVEAHLAQVEAHEFERQLREPDYHVARSMGPETRALGVIDKDIITGTDGDDTLVGTSGNDYISGLAGADAMDGAGGSDTAAYVTSQAGVNVNLVTGTGTGGDAEGDTLVNFEHLRGSYFNDVLTGDGGNTTIISGDGDDILNGGDGNDYLVGGQGADQINGGAGEKDTASYGGAAVGVSASLSGGGSGGDAAGDTFSGIEYLRGSDNNDTLTGDALHNQLTGAGGNDTLSGGDGDDYFVGGAGADSHNGGAGDDLASYAGSPAGVSVSLAGGSGSGGDATGDTFSGIEDLRGSDFADTLTGDGEDNVLIGAAGGDTLSGGAGADSLTPGDGADIIDGGADKDTVSYWGSPSAVSVNLGTQSVSGGWATGDSITSIESVTGSDYNDTLVGNAEPNSFNGQAGNDSINGGLSDDTVSYSGRSGGFTVDLAAGSATGPGESDSLTSIENAVGGLDNDTLRGNGERNVLSGREGNDTLDGRGELDTVSYDERPEAFTVDLGAGTATGAGETDTLISIEFAVGGLGDDTLIGDAGDNVFDGRQGADALIGGAGVDTAAYSEADAGVVADLLSGGSGGDASGDTYSGIENLRGSDFADTLRGDAASNTLVGAEGSDTLEGRDGNDFLIGGLGADTLDGGPGSDQANYAPAEAGVTLDLATGGTGGDAAGDTYIAIENVRGSEFSDDIRGDGNANVIVGAGGDDIIDGAGGNDAILGSGGADIIEFDVGMGTDTIVGFTPGTDRLNGYNVGLTNFGVVQANMVQSGTTTIITAPAGGSIRLNNVDMFSLSQGDFIFSAPLWRQVPKMALEPVGHEPGSEAHARALRPYGVRALARIEDRERLWARESDEA